MASPCGWRPWACASARREGMDGEQNKALVSGYLADRDEPCPRCGYNLRGVESEQCPECGERLELGLVRRRRLGGWGPFLVLALGWLVLAGGMNATREVQRLVRERQAAI